MIQALRQVKHALASHGPAPGPIAPEIPVRARHVELSAIVSADDDQGQASGRLFDVALGAAAEAREISMAGVTDRMARPPYYPEVWPGEHYKLLAGLVAVCQPGTVVEIGTATGLSALAIRSMLPAGSRLVTFDLIPWDQFPDTVFRAEDFADGTISQAIGDVSDPSVLRRHAELFRDADLIFADGPKDGRFEQVLLDRLGELDLARDPLVVLDDVRVWNMLRIWREVKRPKLDITSFGHWSGTGLIDWNG